VAERLVARLLADHVDHVAVSGDVTDRGGAVELALFERIFAPLLHAGRLTVVPGNHDRAGDGHAMRLGRGRQWVEHALGARFVCLDTTAPHNRSLIASHGELSTRQIDDTIAALEEVPVGELRVVVMHHHPLPRPDETFGERLASRLGWPHALELARGQELVERLAGRCDLVLYGHKHVPHFQSVETQGRVPLYLANAGSSTELGAFQVYEHHDGRLVGARLLSLDRLAPVVRHLEWRPQVERAA
jgi:Icc protein